MTLSKLTSGYTMLTHTTNMKPMKLKIYVKGDALFKEEYQSHINKHNSQLLHFNNFPDSGFDLLFPNEEIINEEGIVTFSHKLDLKFSAALYDVHKQSRKTEKTLGMSLFCTLLFLLIANYTKTILGTIILCIGGLTYIFDDDVYSSIYIEEPVPFMLMPRSSTGSKTPLRLSNSVGVIDSGYRGSICAYVDCVKKQEVVISKYQRVFQIVSFSGRPIYVELVDELTELGITERGSDGFGSTGK